MSDIPFIECKRCGGHGYTIWHFTKRVGKKYITTDGEKRTCETCKGDGKNLIVPLVKVSIDEFKKMYPDSEVSDE